MKQRHTCFFNFTTLISLCISLLFSTAVYSQKNALSIKAEELVYSNPDEAIKIGEHILKTTPKPEGKASINLMIARCYFVKGDINNAITHVFEGGNQVLSSDFETRIEINLLKAELFRLLYLDTQSQKHLSLAEGLLPKVSPENVQDSLASYVFLERISMSLDRRHTDEALFLLKQVNKKYDSFLKTHSAVNGKLYIAKEKALSNLTKYDSAFVYLNKSLTLIDSKSYNNLYEKAQVYNQLGHLHLQKKEFKKSEETLFIALKFAEILNNPLLLEQVNRNLAINYLASNQKSKHKVYNDEFLVLNNKVELIEQESVNTVYNIISSQEESFLKNEENKYASYINIVIACALLLLMLGAFFLVKSQWKKKRLREIIKYLEISRNNFINIKPSKKAKTKRIAIPEETERSILSKLKRFETSQKFLNKDMSLAVLSGQFETNTKYLSEIIHKHYHDNFNTFINKLRINFIIDKLKNDSNYMNYKISFLATESGFSSHSSFATVFKSIIGMSPVTFIELLKSEREDLNNINK